MLVGFSLFWAGGFGGLFLVSYMTSAHRTVLKRNERFGSLMISAKERLTGKHSFY